VPFYLPPAVILSFFCSSDYTYFTAVNCYPFFTAVFFQLNPYPAGLGAFRVNWKNIADINRLLYAYPAALWIPTGRPYVLLGYIAALNQYLSFLR
jgi:hypothetical protein